MRFTSSPLQTLPLSGLVLLLAATNACVIVNNGGGGDDDECVELDEVCPSLVCETGHVVVDGCEICECNEVCDPGPAPECASPVLLEEECRWACGSGSCFSDIDCGPGAICVLPGTTVPGEQADPPQGGEAPVPAPDGVCVVVETTCFSDLDCGAGFFCDLSATAGGGGSGAEPPPDNGDRAAPPAPQGTCRALPSECFSDFDCQSGQVCEFPNLPNGLVAPGGVCVDKSECETDADCAEGETCAVECRSDPNCPECDVCLFFGTCVVLETTCFDDSGCAEGEFCDLTGAAERPCLDANGDNICDDIVPVEGVCRPLAVDPCATVRCEAGTTCLVTFANEAVCVADDNRCMSDVDCAEGSVCNAGTDVCLPPPECDPNTDRPCLAVCTGFCVAAPTSCFADSDCAEGEVCIFDPTLDQGGGARPIIAPQGVCGPAPTTCQADTDCGRGEACVNGVCEVSTAPVGCEVIRCIAGTECVEDAAGNGSCQASLGECASTEECPSGSTCNAGDVCNPPPDCERGQLCADVCYGYCVAN